MNKNDPVRISQVVLKAETGKAYGISFDLEDEVEIWIPKSLIAKHGLLRETWGWVEVPFWFAEKEELSWDES